MLLLYHDAGLFMWNLSHRLGSLRRDLNQLKAENLLAGSVETLTQTGYHYNCALGREENLIALASGPLSGALQGVDPRALVFQHCQAESAVLPWRSDEMDLISRNRYFAPMLMKELELDDLPYFCSFASGCAGFITLLATAGGLFLGGEEGPVICLMADGNQPGVTFDIVKERILGSDHSSAFVVGREEAGYQILGVNYYSTTRVLVPLLEVVKRTVQMIEQLASKVGLDLKQSDVVVHYPNIFPDTWKMVTRYLRLPRIETVFDGMAERAHCAGSDSVISLGKMHRSEEGRLHVAVNYGFGLHLAVCLLKEKKLAEPTVTRQLSGPA